MKVRVLAAAGLMMLLAACGGGTTSAGAGATTAPACAPSAAPAAAPAAPVAVPVPGATRTLTVFAASSLTGTFTELGNRFQIDNPGVAVKFNYGASSDLAQQIVNGAPADVFASASDATMKTVTDAGLTTAPPTVFATNVLQIATRPGNPTCITTFADLAKPDLKVVVCAPQVPCGAAAQKIQKATGVTLKPVSEEADVKSTLGKVTSGDADAGLVYVTDVLAAKGTVTGVSFPESAQAKANYPIAVIKKAPQPDLAAKFAALVNGEIGKKTLSAGGFGSA